MCKTLHLVDLLASSDNVAMIGDRMPSLHNKLHSLSTFNVVVVLLFYTPAKLLILYKYYIPCAGDSRKYHPEECDYQPRRSRG